MWKCFWEADKHWLRSGICLYWWRWTKSALLELYFFINYFPVIKTRSPGCSPGRWEILTAKCCSSNAKEVCLGLCKTVIKWAHENTCAELMEALALQLVALHTRRICCHGLWLQFHSGLLHFSTNTLQWMNSVNYWILYSGCCRFILGFVAIVYIHFSLWCDEVYWKNLVCKNLERSGSKGRDTGETMNAGNYLNFNRVS